jgi:hypothetical protein
MVMQSMTAGRDQASLPGFRLTLGVQAIAALIFGLAPLVATAAYASAIGFSGKEVLVYRLGGAATFGYLTAPALALAWHASWRQLRIPAMATITFTLGALVASVWELVTGATQVVIPLVIVAGAAFSLVAAYWLRRDEAPDGDAGRALDMRAQVIIGLATVSAGTFGLLPILAPGPFGTVFGVSAADSWVFRLAGAACLGYATGGIASLRAPGYGVIRLQNLAAITFNGIAAISAWIAVASGSGAWLAPVVAAAASFFAVALFYLDRTLAA